MKTKLKKSAVVLMAIVMVMCYMPMIAFAAEQSAKDEAGLKDAISQSNAEDVITIDASFSINSTVTIPSGKSVTIDLNGKTLDGSGIASSTKKPMFQIESGGSLTIKNGTVKYAGTVPATSGRPATEWQVVSLFKVEKGGTLTIESGTYNTSHYQLITSSGSVLIKDGTFTCTAENSGIYDSKSMMSIEDGGSLTMEKGTITANTSDTPDCGLYGIYCSKGGTAVLGKSGSTEGPTIHTYMAALGANNTTATANFTVYGGSYTCDFKNSKDSDQKWQTPIYMACDGSLNIYGGTFTGKYALSIPYTITKIDCNIYGGNFVSEGTAVDNWMYYNKINDKGTGNGSTDGKANIVKITGGTFKGDPTAYVPTGYVVNGTTGSYTVRTAYVPSPSTPTDSVTNTNGGASGTENAKPSTNVNLSGSTDVKTETKVDETTGETATVVTSTATIDKTTADKIVENAVENKSEEVVIDATTSVTTTSATAAEVQLPAETMKAIVEKTNADVVVKTDAGEVAFDNKAAEAIAEQAATGNVSIVVEKVKDDDAKVEVELKVVTESGNVSDFKGGSVTVTVPLPKAMQEKEVVCVYIDDEGNYTKVAGVKNADGTYSFKTGHFSTYAIMAEEDADKVITEQKTAAIKAGVQATTIKLSSERGTGYIKLSWKKSAGYKVDYYEVFRSTKRSSGYGTKAYFTTKDGTRTTYKNSKGLKKGTRYFYKVRGVRVVDGEKVYTKDSNKAYRVAK